MTIRKSKEVKKECSCSKKKLNLKDKISKIVANIFKKKQG